MGLEFERTPSHRAALSHNICRLGQRPDLAFTPNEHQKELILLLLSVFCYSCNHQTHESGIKRFAKVKNTYVNVVPE